MCKNRFYSISILAAGVCLGWLSSHSHLLRRSDAQETVPASTIAEANANQVDGQVVDRPLVTLDWLTGGAWSDQVSQGRVEIASLK